MTDNVTNSLASAFLMFVYYNSVKTAAENTVKINFINKILVTKLNVKIGSQKKRVLYVIWFKKLSIYILYFYSNAILEMKYRCVDRYGFLVFITAQILLKVHFLKNVININQYYKAL